MYQLHFQLELSKLLVGFWIWMKRKELHVVGKEREGEWRERQMRDSRETGKERAKGDLTEVCLGPRYSKAALRGFSGFSVEFDYLSADKWQEITTPDCRRLVRAGRCSLSRRRRFMATPLSQCHTVTCQLQHRHLMDNISELSRAMADTSYSRLLWRYDTYYNTFRLNTLTTIREKYRKNDSLYFLLFVFNGI